MTASLQWPLPILTVEDPGPRWVTATCRLEPGLDETRVYVGEALFAILPAGDRDQTKFVAAHLVMLGTASVRQVVSAFGFSAASVREWVAQLRRTGTLRPGDFKRGPVGPHKMTPEIFRYLATHPARSHRDMADQIAQHFDVRLSPATVRLYRLRLKETEKDQPTTPATAWFQGDLLADLESDEAQADAEAPRTENRPMPEPTPRTLETLSAEEGMPDASDLTPVLPLSPPEHVAAVGFLVLAPYLTALALPDWAAAHPWTQPHQFAPVSILLAWVLAFLLGARSAESTKMGPRADWGWVIGAPHYPHPDTLRAITHEWTDAGLGPDLAAHCGPRYLTLFPDSPALVYLDGHFIPYAGHAAYAGRGYSTLRHLVLSGHEQFWAHDGQGHPLWVDEAAGNASFYEAIARISERVHQWRTGRLLVVYDRGGVSEDTATALVGQDIDFLCYGKTRAVPATVEWTPLTLERAGQRRTYDIWEHTRRWGSLPAVREIWVREGTHTFPVLTSHATATVPELLTALWGRWKQENSFKRLVQNYGLNHFGDRDVMPLENRPVANPQRTRLARALAKIDQGMGALRRRYPPTEADGDQDLATTAPKTAQTRWAQLQHRLAMISADYEAAPETVGLWDLVPAEQRQAFTFQNKAFQDACRIIAINGEHWLRQRLALVYPDPRHERTLIRWLLGAGGTVQRDGTTLTIVLDRPVRPRWAQAVQDLLTDLNAQSPRYPADPRWTLHFTLRTARKLEFSHKR